jgi:pimeloyl-ACP methyl ester carboxylesterase
MALPLFPPRNRWFRLVGWIALLGATAPTWLFFNQESMIYHPRPYRADELAAARSEGAEPVEVATAQGPQRAWWVPPRTGDPRAPERVWVAFNGNGSVALDWMPVTRLAPRHAFLLVDYPGYGASEGRASPRAIAEAADAAWEAARKRLAGEPPLGVLGFSLGAGAGLQFATRHAPDRAVIFAPFTSLGAMARRRVGWPLCLVLRHEFDNRASLRALAARENPPSVTLFHGREDETVPFAMGEALAAEFPAIVAFRPLDGTSHNGAVDDAMPALAGPMGITSPAGNP